VIGRNDQTIEISSLIGLNGLVDDFADDDSSWQGLKVVRSDSLPSDAVVLNCSTSISPVDVRNRMLAQGISGCLNICDLVPASGGLFGWPSFVVDQRREYQDYQVKWMELWERMADQDSKQTLLDVVRYRLTADVRYMSNYRVRLQDQYFETFLGIGSEVFVDAGGFDGDTTEEFCRRYPDYSAVYLFEPSERNMTLARKRLGRHRDIVFRPEGLSDIEGELCFDPDAGSASSVSSASETRIKVTTLDRSVQERVTFVKMDLEGWELKALSGCRRHIEEGRPKLAISVYHAASDFRRIPEFVLSLNPNYKIYLRHYTQGWSETVMYFV
jgi:FkbM family methyltransferase